MSGSQGASLAQSARSLLAAKDAAGTTISVCLPACNEAATIGPIVTRIRADLVDAHPLVDEIVVVDDSSTDETARIARTAGARVVRESDILADVPDGSGKGN